MGGRNKVEGRIYSFRSKQECADLGLPFPNVSKIVACHMVLVLDWVPQQRGYVEVMTITSSPRSDGEYLPISQTPKESYPIQLRLHNGPETIHWNMRCINLTVLRKLSYLKIDSRYHIPLSALREEEDHFGCQLMLCLTHEGGIRHLRSFLRSGNRSRQHRPASGGKAQVSEFQSISGASAVSNDCDGRLGEEDE
ncbi:hypothetical protein BDV96DRAFT_570594 [Lophiotrema nucula]|uniref:Uncharacterized protein n=1 Tax=Lophiotrema nucula TaxID=690887 RepID=A0A6A5ZFY2_9PLEO|nr:hypothetical protein BDV96DRAFT_570594 [Lophiotrema nucula]